MGCEDPVEPALVGSAGHGAGEVESPGAVHVAGVDRADVDAELHLPESPVRTADRRTSEVADSTRCRAGAPPSRRVWRSVEGEIVIQILLAPRALGADFVRGAGR